MLNGSFESTLRGGGNPQTGKNRKHVCCKGQVHGTGTYNKDGGFQRTPSKRYSKPAVNKSAPSSEGVSESDSLDSLGDKVATRLYSSTTKASIAKTITMRHLDIFNLDDTDWCSDLRKSPKVKRRSSTKRKKFDSVNYQQLKRVASIRKSPGFFGTLDEKECFKDLAGMVVCSFVFIFL